MGSMQTIYKALWMVCIFYFELFYRVADNVDRTFQEVWSMGIFVNPGNDGFRQSLNSEIYVDKSDLISLTKEIYDEYVASIRIKGL